MERTQLYLPAILKREALKRARAIDVSLAELVRQALQMLLSTKEEKKSVYGANVLLQMAAQAQKKHAKGPKDLAINHDDYLYGDKSL